jgi:hypothetical protein
MNIQYDPDKFPEVTPEQFRVAGELNLHVVVIHCDEPDAEVGDPAGVSFVTLVPFLPRVGDRIYLEDGSVCEVRGAVFKLVSNGEIGASFLTPNVKAVRIGKM